MMMVRLKNSTSNIDVKIIKHSQNGSKCKIEPFFIFIRYKIKFKKNKMCLNRLKIEIRRIYILFTSKMF